MPETSPLRRIAAWVDAAHLDDSPITQARVRVQHMVVLITVLVSIPYTLLFLLNDLWMPAIFSSLAAPSSLIGLRLTRSGAHLHGGSLVVLSLFTAILTALVVRGGMESNSAIWLLLCPVLAFMMLGPRLGVSMGLLIAATCAVLWGLQTGGLDFPSALPRNVAWVMVGVDHIVVPVCIALLMWSHADVWRRMVESLDATNQALETEVHIRQDAEEVALAAAQARYTFLATMSHEIRTPLNGVLGLTDALLDSELDDSQRALAETVRGSGRLLRSLLDDVLDFSKIDTGRLVLEDAPMGLKALCQDLERTWSPAARERGLTLALTWLPDAPDWIHGDEHRLRQLLGNLLSNALKFTEQGGVTLTVGAENGVLLLDVADTGVGIPGEALPGIFKPFQQADSSTTRRFGGTGLGLAICWQIVEAMGGELGAESAPGVGTTFRVVLPLRPAMPCPGGSPTAIAPHTMAGMRVLVAEDSPLNQMVMQHLLGRHGLAVSIAEDGAQVLQMWEQEHPALILMDCQMPVLDGFEATRRLRALGVSVPIIAVTANNMPGDRERCLAAGMDDFMDKPVQREVLDEKLVRWLSRKERAPVPV